LKNLNHFCITKIKGVPNSSQYVIIGHNSLFTCKVNSILKLKNIVHLKKNQAKNFLVVNLVTKYISKELETDCKSIV